MRCLFFVALTLWLACPVETSAAAAEPLGIAMETYAYPYPVHFFKLTIEGQDLRMAYAGQAGAKAQPTSYAAASAAKRR